MSWTHAQIEVGDQDGNVYIQFRPDPDVDAGEIHHLTPEKARTIAAGMLRAADLAEQSMPAGWAKFGPSE